MIVAMFDVLDGEYIEEFNDWYSRKHVLDFLKAPGLISGRRFYWKRKNGYIRFLALYEHNGKCSLQETLESNEARAAVQDFEEQWQGKVGPPDFRVYKEIGVGENYSGWPPPWDKG